ncbi:MAG: TIR domain-containing protein [Enterococcus raffinosus]
MARRVFFSFYYENDLSRALVVKNNWALKENEESGFINKGEFERIKRDGEESIRRWIDKQLAGTSVTVVLIGSETLDSEYVQYEIEKAMNVGTPSLL